MANAAALNVSISATTDKFSAGIGKAKSELSSFEKSLGLAKSAAMAFGVGLGASEAVSFIKSSVAAYESARHEQQKLAAVLESTGHAAGFSKDQLSAYASELQKITNYDDDVVAGSEAVLATFTKIRGVQFTEAVKSILDISTVLDTDLKSSAVQVGKALNDPIKGITALRRVGVSFTADQLAMVKSMVEANDIIGAQNLILAELKTEFGGAAESVRSELKGLENDWGDLKEAIGSFSDTDVSKTALKSLATSARSASSQIQDVSKAFNAGTSAAERFKGVLSAIELNATGGGALSALAGKAAGLAKSYLPEAPAITPSSNAGDAAAASKQAAMETAKFTAEIQKEIDALQFEIDALGKSAAEKKLMALASKAAEDGLGKEIEGTLADAKAKLEELEAEKALNAAFDGVNAAREAANAAAQKQIEQLQMEASLWGKTASEAADYRRQQAGVEEGTRRIISALEDEAAAHKKHDDFLARQKDRQTDFDKRDLDRRDQEQRNLTDQFKSLEEANKTPQEALDKKLADLKKLEDAGFGSTAGGKETLSRAREAARKEFADATGAERKQPEGNQALLAGAPEAFSAIFRAPRSGNDQAQKSRQQMVNELQKARKASEATARALAAAQPVIVGEMPH